MLRQAKLSDAVVKLREESAAAIAAVPFPQATMSEAGAAWPNACIQHTIDIGIAADGLAPEDAKEGAVEVQAAVDETADGNTQ